MDLGRAVLLSLLGLGAFAVVMVLPGVRLADRLAGPSRSPVARGALALVVSQVLLAVAGSVLVALGRFSGPALAVVMIVFAATSAPVLVRWIRLARGALWPFAWAGLLAAPWVAFVGASGWPPADTLQWYYDGLGRQLAAAGGIPAAVAEWGLHVRWLPDYLVFNLDSEAYLALLQFLPRTDALAAWRVPVVLSSLLLVAAALRLWVARPLALGGAVLAAGTTFGLAKFDAYKPEALGIVLGLAALWLVVAGLRHGRRSWVLLGGATLGIGLAVHAIAATVMGLLVAGFGAAEWLGLPRRRLPALGWLVRAAALGLLISVVLGVGLQGRAVVASEALTPEIVEGEDPTWTFFLRSTGTFTEPPPPPPQRPLAGGVTSPWPGFRVTSAFGWWLIPVSAIGLLAFVALGGRKARRGVAGLLAAGGLVGAGVAFFALSFDTYVPRWTGLVRFGQYAPLLVSLAVAMAAAGYLRAWAWLAERRVSRVLVLVAAVVGVAWLVPGATARYSAEARIAPDGLAALEAARTLASRGDLIVSNVLTTGTIEAFTGLEAPLEGRQPLIEDPEFLAIANQRLLDAHRWFTAPVDRAFLDGLGARWVLAADDPATLGASGSLGGTPAALGDLGWLREAWSSEGIGLFEVREPAVAAAVVDRRDPVVDLPRATGAALLGLAGGALLALPLPAGWRRRSRRGGGAVNGPGAGPGPPGG